jgi:hypothetical protein
MEGWRMLSVNLKLKYAKINAERPWASLFSVDNFLPPLTETRDF